MLISFYFNKNCNWDCYYCNEGDKSKFKTKTDDELLTAFKNAIDVATCFCKPDEYLYIGIVGGEPGLWSEYLWDTILSISKEYKFFLKIFTNGTIFNHPSFKIEHPRVEFIWHCSHDLEPVKLPYIRKNITYNELVITHENLIKLDEFLSINSDMEFKTDVVQSSFYKKNYIFTKSDWEYLSNILSKHKNIERGSFISILMAKNQTTQTLQNICKRQKSLSLIDLSEDIIYRCCEYTDRFPLTEENLYKHFNNNLFIIKNCGSCINHIFYYMEK